MSLLVSDLRRAFTPSVCVKRKLHSRSIGFALVAIAALVSPGRAGAVGHEAAEFVAEYAVKPYLKDPDSAKFSGVYGADVGPWSVICGYVNSKNGFGGYMGDQPFIVIVMSTTDTEVHFVSNTRHKDFKKLWAMCG